MEDGEQTLDAALERGSGAIGGTVVTTTTTTTPVAATTAPPPRRLYIVRFGFALVWAVLLFATASSIGAA